MDVRAWLRGLGLEQYAEAFAANDIDGALLRDLGAEDLRELGVGSLGHRKRLLAAIAELDRPDFVAESGPRPAAAEPERRPVVVLFADLCGFTEMSQALGDEETHRIVEAFLGRADTIVAEHGGTVDKHLGDATMALFGAPVAHGDDALRAVAAADALQRAMPALSARLGRPLQTHVGIAMGDVVAGAIGTDVHRAYTVLGDSVNLAARLVGAAAPGETVVSEPVWRAVADRMAGHDLGPRVLKGIAAPQRLWRLLGPRETVSAGRLPFVGRELELAQTVAVITGVLGAAGPGAVLHLRGEAGMGKSRLLAETLAEAERRGFAPILVRLVDFGADRRQSPLRALAEGLARRLPGWAEAPALEDAARAALHDVLDRPLPPALAQLWSAMEDAQRTASRGGALAALAGLVAAETPLAIAVEDLHWAGQGSDGPMRAVVAALARTAATSRLVLLTTSRLDGDPIDTAFRRSLGAAPLTVIELGPLRPEALQRLAQAATHALRAADAERLAVRSGGNPLFLEQLALSGGDGDAAARPLPGTIRALVQARLDRLAPADRAALQAASVLGQRFALVALQTLLRRPDYDVAPLIEAGLLAWDGDRVMFSHALLQESTYASLLGEAARGLHRRAAEGLGDDEPDLRASHLERAGDPAAPAAYRLAAERWRRGGNLGLALERAERGLALAAAGSEATERAALGLLAGHLRLELGAAREAEARFRAVLAEAGDDRARRAEAELGIAAALRIVDDLDGAAAAVDRAQAEAETLDQPALRARCHFLRGNLLFPRGQVEACMAEHRRALALAERAQSPQLSARALGGLMDAHYAQGRMRSALAALERCVAAARAAGAGAVEIANGPMGSLFECFLLRLDRARERGQAARALARQAQNRRAELISLHGLLMAAMESGDPAAGLPLVAPARAIVAELGAWRFEGENLIFAAALEAQAGRRAAALATARQALDLCRQHAPAFVGPLAFGIAAALADDPAERDGWLREGEALLHGGSLGHNHLYFRRNAIEAALAAGRPDEARRHATALEAYAAPEPLPFTDLVVRRARLLADAAEDRLGPPARADLAELATQTERVGFRPLAAAMRAALET
ncbi:MAG: adenylate/guanylate cyclase domain-containing protein [Reyranellaceae bacterium]